MIINIQDDILKIQVLGLLDRMLADKTTKKNIMWATDAYDALGMKYERNEEITSDLITGHHASVIKTRARKAMEQQTERTRQHAEVFTPFWVCQKMNDYADEVWFGTKDVFFKDGKPTEKIEFQGKDDWKEYVDSKRLEITCGEAPYLVSRYDVETGEMIPIPNRIGILDRKLQVVNENADTEKLWLSWVVRAFQATYGYEFQGDNLLIARMNLLMTFEEYMQQRWQRKPTIEEYRKITNIIVWNIWQMDGLTGTVPYGTVEEAYHQMDLMEFLGLDEKDKKENKQPRCLIFDWRGSDSSVEFLSLQRKDNVMKFDFIIGNPPYQEEAVGANANDTPIYHYFYDSVFQLANHVELISPARFLFNAGGTPKEWNEKMLRDEHIKVLMYEPKSEMIFVNTSISGGVVIIYRDATKNYGAIDVFTPYEELNAIVKKVERISVSDISCIVSNRGMYRYSDLVYEEEPEEMKKTADKRIAPSAFERMPKLFTEQKPEDGNEYIQIYGNIQTKRVFRWFRKDYLSPVESLYKYKVFISKADGAAGQIGSPVPARISGKPIVMGPGIGSTETYISIGSVDTIIEAEAISKYIQTKFARTMLGVLKVTQNYAKPTWRKIPLQDFTSSSDIDWSKSIQEIDRQLYAKYGLDENEINFIESHVKEME